MTSMNKATAGTIAIAAMWLVAAVAAQQKAAPAQASPSGVGRAPTAAELKAWDIAVHPDGHELPPGSGNATQGVLVFTQRGCSDCHGPNGKEGPAPVLVGGKVTTGTNTFPVVFWPFAPTIWDFIHRAMPYNRPGRLTVDEAYALTAFILFKNGIIQEDDVMDQKSLPKVQMPHRGDYKMPPDWTPQTSRGFKVE
jgi:hypothetical protein